MTIEALDHINLRTDDVPTTIAFFRDILDLAVDLPPGLDSIEHGAWLRDDKGHPVVHIGAKAAEYPTDHVPAFNRMATGPIHHVAFNCSDYDASRTRIEGLGHEIVENDLSAIGLRQLFVRAPGDLVIELNFWSGKQLV